MTVVDQRCVSSSIWTSPFEAALRSVPQGEGVAIQAYLARCPRDGSHAETGRSDRA